MYPLENTFTISQAFEKFRQEYIVYRNQSAKTEEMSRLACRSLLQYVGDINIGDLTFDAIRRWKEDLEKTRSPNTVRGYVIKLRVVLKHLAQQGYRDILNPEVVGVPKRRQVVVEFLTPDEVSQYIASAVAPKMGYSRTHRVRNGAIIALLYASGIRVTELCNLDRTFLREGMDSFTVMGKGGKARLCFIDERAQHLVREYLATRKDNHPALFLGRHGGRINKGGVELMFRHNNKRCSMQVHPHMMRHSFATNMLRNNTNLLYVSKFLGHASVQTTEMYTHIVDEDLRAIYRKKHTT